MLTRYNRAIPSLCNTYGHSEIVKLSTFKARYTLRKECASTGKSINCFGPSFSWCTCTLRTFVFNLELCSLRSTAYKQLKSSSYYRFISTLLIFCQLPLALTSLTFHSRFAGMSSITALKNTLMQTWCHGFWLVLPAQSFALSSLVL